MAFDGKVARNDMATLQPALVDLKSVYRAGSAQTVSVCGCGAVVNDGHFGRYRTKWHFEWTGHYFLSTDSIVRCRFSREMLDVISVCCEAARAVKANCWGLLREVPPELPCAAALWLGLN